MNRKEYLKQYYLKNKNKYNQRSKKYYEDNKDRCLMLNEEWRLVNKEYLKKYKHDWYKRKKETRAEVRLQSKESIQTIEQTSITRSL